ncbi:unnamed protein product, partial [marine sediment metagenome]
NSTTDITFTCTDQGPHPSGDEELCFKVSFDEPSYPTYLTTDYCTKYGGTIDNEYCCVPADPQNPFVFNFNKGEDSYHDLEYFCRDAVEKESGIEIQYYKVDDTPPKIIKEMFGSFLGDCPKQGNLDHGDCYVADDGTSGVEIWVADPDPTGNQCAVDQVSCYYELHWIPPTGGDQIVSEGPFSDHQKITFTEDSTHMLLIECEDALGNYFEDNEEFLVDSTPPETTKTYVDDKGELLPPYFDDNHWEYIDTVHKVNLIAEDEKVGVEEIRYKVSGSLADRF